MTLRVALTGPRYGSDAQVRGYAAALLERARATPGVRDAAIASTSPLSSGPLVYFVLPGRQRPAPSEEPQGDPAECRPRILPRARHPDHRGPRLYGQRRRWRAAGGDRQPGPRRASVSRRGPHRPHHRAHSRARASWTRRPGQLTIVGVSGNVKEVGFNEVDFNDIHVPFAQMPAPGLELVARAGVPPAAVIPALRAAAATIDPRLPISSMSTLEQRVDNALREDRFNLLMVAAFAGAALVLASVGIFGALAYAVQERRREFGVRIALGAQRPAIVLAAVGRSLRVAGAGGLAGLVATLVLARIIGNALYLVPGEHNGLLYGVTTTDPDRAGIRRRGADRHRDARSRCPRETSDPNRSARRFAHRLRVGICDRHSAFGIWHLAFGIWH